MSLPEFLKYNGYSQIPLSKNAVGHFETRGSLNGNDISVLIDTGAGGTVISLETAQRHGIAMTLAPFPGGGAGNANMEVYLLESADLSLNGISLRTSDVVAMDLSHANEALAMKGSSPIEAVLGIDVFQSHEAIIDYGSNSLYLKL